MKRIAQPRKLSLQRESIRNLRQLDEVRLKHVIGGVSLPGNPCGTTTHTTKVGDPTE